MSSSEEKHCHRFLFLLKLLLLFLKVGHTEKLESIYLQPEFLKKGLIYVFVFGAFKKGNTLKIKLKDVDII